MALLGLCCTMCCTSCWQHSDYNMFQHHLHPVLVSNDSLSITINMLYVLHVQRVFFVTLSMTAVTKTLSPLKADSARNLELIFPLLLSVPNVIEDVCFANLQFMRRRCTFWLADLEILTISIMMSINLTYWSEFVSSKISSCLVVCTLTARHTFKDM
jgi:hypothetical protein